MTFSFSLCLGQDWERKINKYTIEELYGSAPAENGDIISVGNGKDSNNGDESSFLIVRTHANGDTLWVKKITGNSAYDVIRTLDGNFAFAGSYQNESVWGKFDQNGDILWTKKSGIQKRNGASFIREDKEGNLYLGGNIYSEANSSMDLHLIKTNINGDTIWTRTTGTKENEFAATMKKVSDGVVLAGYSIIAHYNAAGDLIFSKEHKLKDAYFSYIKGIELTKDGNYMAACSTFYLNKGIFLTLMKIDQNGDTLWTKTHQDQILSTYSMTTAYDSNFVVICSVNWGADQLNSMIKIDQNGDTLWTKIFYGSPRKISYADGYFIVSGSYSFGQPENITDMYLLKVKDDSDPQILNISTSTNENERFQIYPNPSNGLMYIDSDLKLEESLITITNMHGIEVYQEQISLEKGIIEVPGLSNGTYQLQVKQGDNNYNRLIIIQK
ncbi:MAG: T9SS type A sorting domain-containing protein [Sporocytophaga sp.]|uniref:T9SS type A sorting domain-containing protein n=1 Tax=Sporocytophaga sp. TaxID=2231183 RepID=UPI001B0E2CA4|nr:T9SS type A sorting domain-containing protein [Sporocytophaga sp.]MBO9701748.1 T9SS type A sorting domain-containing protein [Sporocytophaga sp.]